MFEEVKATSLVALIPSKLCPIYITSMCISLCGHFGSINVAYLKYTHFCCIWFGWLNVNRAAYPWKLHHHWHSSNISLTYCPWLFKTRWPQSPDSFRGIALNHNKSKCHLLSSQYFGFRDNLALASKKAGLLVWSIVIVESWTLGCVHGLPNLHMHVCHVVINKLDPHELLLTK